MPKWLLKTKRGYSCYGTITSNDDDAIAYAQQAAEAAHLLLGDTIIDVDFASPILYNGGILIGFSQKALNILAKWRGRDVFVGDEFESYISFELKHSYFHRQHMALEHLPPYVIQKILPDTRTNRKHYPSVRETHESMLKLDNTGQQQALRAILNDNTITPVIVAGPFGTGKTRVLARAAFELLTQNLCNQPCKILICAHHQASADTFIEYFGKLQRKNVLSKSIVIVRVTTRDYHSKTSNEFPDYFKTIAEFPDYFKTTVDAHSHITVSTLGLTMSSQMECIKPLTHIFIDEAAQTRETEAIIPLTLAGRHTKIVIAGDHCQVSEYRITIHKKLNVGLPNTTNTRCRNGSIRYTQVTP